MNSKKIKEIQDKYKELNNHEKVMGIFGLTHAEEYAINIYGRDNHLTCEFLASRLDKVKAGMTSGQIQDVLR
jgi:hypothetical protein